MKKRILLFAALCMTQISCAKIEGEGEILTKDFNVSSSATEISVENTIKLKLSDELSAGEMIISTHENIFKYIEIKDHTNEIDIELKDKKYNDLDIEVVVSSKQYSDIEASGASEVLVVGDRLSFNNYEITLSGASSFRGDIDVVGMLDIELSGASRFVGDISGASILSLELSGASSVDATGSAIKCEAELSGASEFTDTSFACDDLLVDLSGASRVKIGVNNTIAGKLSGASSVKYKGSPTVSVDTNGSSSVEEL